MATTTSLVPFDKKEKKTLPPESLNEIVPPLDYSFLKLTTLEECLSEAPRITSPRKTKAISQKAAEDNLGEKSKSTSFRVNNNELKEVSTIMTVVTELFIHPHNMQWLDLSYNSLGKIDPVLTQFENLHILYLHGNEISELKEVNKLGTMKTLLKLSLHGNPFEEIKGYRAYCIATVSELKNFDFAAITKADRAVAKNWKMMNKPKPVRRDRDHD